jgi:CheY-like chemotaxis protein
MQSSAGAGLESLRVLVAEDNEHMRSILVEMLHAVSIKQVREASNGRDALAALGRWTADLAFVDLRMDPVDGIEFTRTVRASTQPYLPIIMLTGYASAERVKEARDAGVTDFLVKPLAPERVVERLRAVIEKQRPFIRSQVYVGPDRRRRQADAYAGPWRRESDSAQTRPKGAPRN